MRWSLQWQLLLPMVAVLVLAIGMASFVAAWLGVSSVRQLQQEQLRRAVSTLSDATFPLSEPVLHSMRNLTGAEYLVFAADGRLQDATLRPDDATLATLKNLGEPSDLADLSRQPQVRFGDDDYIAARVQLKRRTAAGDESWLCVLVPQRNALVEFRQAAYPPLIAGAAALLVSLITTLVVGRRIAQPIARLGQQAERIAQGDFRPLPIAGPNDEIRDLGASINQMAEKLEQHTEQVRRSERLRTLDLLSSGLAHQMRNSVMGARMALELHQRECGASQDESIGVSLTQLTLMESYLQRFLTLGKPDSHSPTRLELRAFLDELLELIRPACQHAGVQLAVAERNGEIWIAADAELLRQMLANLLFNALDAVRSRGQDGRIEIECRRVEETALIRIGDCGDGPAAEIQQSMFQPFVTDKPDGTGLGLAVAQQIARRHGGSIEWQREQGMTYFDVRLPATSNA